MEKAYKCLLTNLATGEEILLPSINAARKYINVSTNTLHYRLNKQQPCEINGFKLERR